MGVDSAALIEVFDFVRTNRTRTGLFSSWV